MAAKEVTAYIQACLADGVSSFEAICDRAKKRIAEIDVELHNADALRAEKIQLTSILRELNDDSVKRRRVAASVPTIELDDNSLAAQHLRFRICATIETEGELSNREIIQKVGSYQEEQRIIRAIKFLGENGILARGSDRKHIPGPNWNQRPVEPPVDNTSAK